MAGNDSAHDAGNLVVTPHYFKYQSLEVTRRQCMQRFKELHYCIDMNVKHTYRHVVNLALSTLLPPIELQHLSAAKLLQ
jgi:hypothetical protein